MEEIETRKEKRQLMKDRRNKYFDEEARHLSDVPEDDLSHINSFKVKIENYFYYYFYHG